MVFALYILLIVSFLIGGLSLKYRLIDVVGLIVVGLFLYFTPLAFYGLEYEFDARPRGGPGADAIARTFAILNYFGEPIRILVLSQPLAYWGGKMCFEIRKTLRELR